MSETKSHPDRKSPGSAQAWRERKKESNAAREKQKFEKGKGWTR